MSTCIRPSQREVMELQRRCLEECQPYINLMAREASMDLSMAWLIRKDGSLERIEQSDSPATAYARTMVDAIVEKYMRLASGEEPANTACKTTNL